MSTMSPPSTEGETHGSTAAAMTMTFIQSTATPLLSSSWQPRNSAEYAATCLFLIALAALTRVLVAIRPVLDAVSWRRRAPYQRQEEGSTNSTELHTQGDTKDTLPPRGRPAGSRRAVMVAIRDHWNNAALSSRLARAAYDMVIAGLGYLVYVMSLSTFLPLHPQCPQLTYSSSLECLLS